MSKDWQIQNSEGKVWEKKDKAACEQAIDKFGDDGDFTVIDPNGNEYEYPPTTDESPTEAEVVESDEPEPAEPVEAEFDERTVPEPQSKEVNPSKTVHDPEGIMPGWMKSEIQHGNGDAGIDLNKRGTQVVSNMLGLEVNAECEVSAIESDFEYSRYRATVKSPNGQTYNAVGDCHIDEQGKSKWDLERMAETRAKKRAVKWASGGGLEVFAE